MPSPDFEKSLKLSDLRKLVREYDEKQEFGSFKKKTDEEVKAQVEMFKEIHTLNATQRAFTELYSKTEEKRRVEEQKRVRERLQTDGNFKAFLFQQTEGLRKSFHSTWDIKTSDLGKGITKGLNTFGLFGKFDTSSLIRKFDEYKGFTKERQEKVFDVKMLNKIEEMILKENANIDDVKKFLQLNGLTNSKIADLLYEFNKGYTQSVDSIIHQGVLRFEDTKNIIDELKNKSLIEKEIIEDKTTPDILGDIKPESEVEKKMYETEVESGKELIRQGNLLSEINESLNKQVIVMEEEVRLTEEDRNRKKALSLKTEEKTENKGMFSNLFQSIPGMKMLMDWIPKVLPFLATPLAIASISILAGGAIGYGISELIKSLLIGSKEKQDINERYVERRKELLSEKEKVEREIYGPEDKAYLAVKKGSPKDIALGKKLQDINDKLAENENEFKVKMDEVTLKESERDRKQEELEKEVKDAKKNKWSKTKQSESSGFGNTPKLPELENSKSGGNLTQFNINQKQGYRFLMPTDAGAKGQGTSK